MASNFFLRARSFLVRFLTRTSCSSVVRSCTAPRENSRDFKLGARPTQGHRDQEKNIFESHRISVYSPTILRRKLVYALVDRIPGTHTRTATSGYLRGVWFPARKWRWSNHMGQEQPALLAYRLAGGVGKGAGEVDRTYTRGNKAGGRWRIPTGKIGI